MRFSFQLTTSVTLATSVMMIACGTDEKPTVCQGHLCGAALLNDGGDIDVNSFILPFGAAVAWSVASFYKNQVPAKTAYLPRDSCVNLKTGAYIPYITDAPTPNKAMHVVTREYIDAGSKVTLTNQRGETIELLKQTDNFDFYGRHQNLFYAQGLPDPANGLPFGPVTPTSKIGGESYNTTTQLQVTIEGSATFPAQTYSGGVGTERPGLVMPNRGHFNLPLATTANTMAPCDPMNPTAGCCDSSTQTCTGPAFSQMPRDEWNVTWDVADNVWEDEAVFLVFVDLADNNYVLQCVAPASAGALTIKKADLDILPELGVVSVGHLVHMFNEVDGRRIDMATISCSAMVYQKMPAM